MAHFIRLIPRGVIRRRPPGSAAVVTASVFAGLLVFALWSLTDGITPSHGQNDDPDGIPDREPPGGYGVVETTHQPSYVPMLRTTGRPAAQASPTFASLSVSADHACAVSLSGSIACWGRNWDNQATPPSGSFKSVSAGRFHSCGIRVDDTVTCWGKDVEGTPERDTFRSVTAGDGACGITDTGSIKCWGDNIAHTVQGDFTFQQVSVGFGHTCAVRTDGNLQCWGTNGFGEASPPTGTFQSVSAGDINTCGVRTDGTLACWGSNWEGRSTPPSGTFKSVAAIWNHACGVRTDSTLSCWGHNVEGQATPPAGTFQSVGVGSGFSCGLRTDGSVVCWGRNRDGSTDAPGATGASATPEPTNTPGPPPPPYPITATPGVGADADKVTLSWGAVDDAAYFRIGWIAASDYQDAGQDWQERFVYAEVANKTTYRVTRLTPGEYYYFVVGSATERYGPAEWSAWIGVMLNSVSQSQSTAQTAEPGDYDADDNRLIEIANLAQLDAIRHDLHGLGSSEHSDYLSAFPNAIAGMGCPPAGCIGYELTTDLNLDTNGNGEADTGDDYWNDGAGWEPIGTTQQPFGADFHGNGHTVSNLHINRHHQYVGFFGYIGPAGVVQQVGLVDADVSGFWDVGALAGWNAGIIKGSYATGSMSGSYAIGGLVGWNGGTIMSSNAEGHISGVINNAGGLVAGTNPPSIILSSYSSVSINGGTNLGGLVGEYRGGKINHSYATGDVRGTRRVGGLMGIANALGLHDIAWNNDEVVDSYSMGRVSGNGDVGGLIGLNELDRIEVRNSYWDMETSGLSASQGGVGKTSVEMKAPAARTGIYANWSPEWWDFGDANAYPALRSSGRDMAVQRQ